MMQVPDLSGEPSGTRTQGPRLQRLEFESGAAYPTPVESPAVHQNCH